MENSFLNYNKKVDLIDLKKNISELSDESKYELLELINQEKNKVNRSINYLIYCEKICKNLLLMANDDDQRNM